MESKIEIRTASPEDAKVLSEIYSFYVKETPITFEYEVPAPEEFAARIRTTLKSYPYLVALKDSVICGYAYASSFKSRAAYDWSVETSIYVREGAQGGGIGSALYRKLEEYLRAQHVCNLCACITYPNPRSEAFHASHGYTTVAHFHHSGYKLSQWWDMIWMEKELTPHQVPPAPFLPFSELPSDIYQ